MEFLRTLFSPGDVFEVRVLGASCPGWRTPHTEAGYFDYDHIDEVQPALDALASYAGVYATINPVNPALLARASNRLIGAQRNATTGDSDVLTRHWLFIDVDPDRPSGISATNAEKESARETALVLRDILAARGWPEPVEVDSGNGFYLLYRIDLPPQDDGLVHRCLQACAKLVDGSTVHIDTSVANPARIARIPGTWNRKGDNLPERPHRKTQALHIPDTLHAVPLAHLEALAGPPAAVKTTKIRKPTPEPGDKARPGDLYNANADLGTLLTGHGWQLTGEHEGNQQWRRPGKLAGNHSATWNGEVFYVFSSAAEPFSPNTGYSPFGVYALLEHGGDHHAAAQALAQAGYKDPAATYPAYPGVDLTEFLAQFEQAPAHDPEEPFPSHLLMPPGFMGAVISHNLDTAPKPQPILALAGALALQAILCARKVKTVFGTRPNLMLCGVAPSGAGKDHARALNRQILVESGLSHLHAEGLKSGSALVNALSVNPAILFQLDEYGRFLKASRNPERNPYAYEIISKLLTLYSSSGSLYETDRYADREKGGVRIQDPHAIIYGTTVPRSLYEGLTEESVTDGFLARTLIFDVDGNQPLRRIVQETPIPTDIIEQAKWWGAYNPGGGNLNPKPRIIALAKNSQELALAFIQMEAKAIADMKDSPLATLWTRTAQNADKLALLHALSVDPETPEITLVSAQWGYDLAKYLTERMIALIGENVASSQFHGETLKIKKILQKNGGKLTRNELLRKAKIRSRDLDEILEYLLQAETIKIVESKSSGGRPKTEYAL